MEKLDTEKSQLIAEFLKDHQQFSRLLYQIQKLLESGEIEKAKQRARELDQLAGPHIQFEERELYPRLSVLGARNVTEEMLVHQHHDALDALQQLIDLQEEEPESISQIKSGFEGALRHAEHCGSLISLMTLLDDNEQTQALQTLLDLRVNGKRWTELNP